MNRVKFLLTFSALVAVKVAAHSDSSSDERPEYECANVFKRYNLDDEPAEWGLSAGEYAPGKTAYVGLSVWQKMMLVSGRLQLDPPGVLVAGSAGPGNFVTDTSQAWFLKRGHRHKYAWVKSRYGAPVPFAVEYGAAGSGIITYVGRIVSNGTVQLGFVATSMGALYYVDQNGMSNAAGAEYEVLTCMTHRNEAKIPPPPLPSQGPSGSASLCVDNWIAYDNDDAPAKNGIAAGEYECGNVAYVGKAKPNSLFLPGRVQTVKTPGVYVSSANKETAVSGFYLADNAKYTYRWEPFIGNESPPNTVFVRNPTGAFGVGIARVSVDGHTKIGYVLPPVAFFAPNSGAGAELHTNVEILVCDPWPKFQCSQQWNAFDASSLATNGLSVDEGVTFVGRGIRKCINNGCDFGVGAATVSGGITFLDDLTATPVNGNTGEYLVKDAQNTYKWAPSKGGEQVANAVELKTEGHIPFYIGKTIFNNKLVIGKVRPGRGLFFIDADGKQKVTSSYNVLTCFSPDANNGVWKKKSDTAWFGSFGCPIRMEWSYKKWRCVCRDEFRGLFPPNSVKWIEETCSYVTA